MRMLCISALSLAALLFAPGAQAATAPPTPLPNVKPDFSSMRYFLGTWNCRTLKRGGHFTRGVKRTETNVSTMTADGHYLQTDWSSKPFDQVRTWTLSGREWMTYDTARKVWYRFGMSNDGGFGLTTSPGWKGDSITWTSAYLSDGDPPVVSTWTKAGLAEYTVFRTVKTHEGIETRNDECTKA